LGHASLKRGKSADPIEMLPIPASPPERKRSYNLGNNFIEIQAQKEYCFRKSVRLSENVVKRMPCP